MDEIINQDKINGKSKPLALTKSFTKKCKNLKIRYGRGNILVGKCPVGEASVGKVFGRGSVSRGSIFGEVSVGELSNRETVLQSIC